MENQREAITGAQKKVTLQEYAHRLSQEDIFVSFSYIVCILSSPEENIFLFCWGYIPIERIPFPPNHHRSYPWLYHILSLCLFARVGTFCCPNSYGVCCFQVGSSPVSGVSSSWPSFLYGCPYLQINIKSHMSLTSRFSFPRLVRLPYPSATVPWWFWIPSQAKYLDLG